MTVVGKILVFFNLIFSLIVGAFVVTVYIAQTHWAHDYNDLKQQYEVASAAATQYQSEVAAAKNATKDLDGKLGEAELAQMAGIQQTDDVASKLAKIKGAIKTAQGAADAQKAAADKAMKDLSAKQTEFDAAAATVTSAKAEVEKRAAESEKTKNLLKDETKKNLDLAIELGKEHDQVVAWKIRADSAERREKELTTEMDRLARDNQKLLANGGTLVSTSNRKDAPNPPPDSVEGLVSEVTPSGLVRITIGSDAGLVKGNTLEVYRLNTQVPDQSKYLGRIKIIEVTNTEAVGQPMSKLSGPLQPGDTVSSRIIGG